MMLNKPRKPLRYLRLFMLMMMLKPLLPQDKLTMVRVLTETDQQHKNVVHSLSMLKTITSH